LIDQVHQEIENSTIVKDNDEALATLAEKISGAKQKFIWCQLYGQIGENETDKTEISKILKKVRNVYELINEDSFLVLLLAGDSKDQNMSNSVENFKNYQHLQKGRCFIKHKNNEIETLDKLIRAINTKRNEVK
jgi:hypothetical protein